MQRVALVEKETGVVSNVVMAPDGWSPPDDYAPVQLTATALVGPGWRFVDNDFQPPEPELVLMVVGPLPEKEADLLAVAEDPTYPLEYRFSALAALTAALLGRR